MSYSDAIIIYLERSSVSIGNSTVHDNFPRHRSVGLKRFKWSTSTLGNFWMLNDLVIFLRSLHFEQV